MYEFNISDAILDGRAWKTMIMCRFCGPQNKQLTQARDSNALLCLGLCLTPLNVQIECNVDLYQS